MEAETRIIKTNPIGSNVSEGVSVIIPAFNVAKYLVKSVRSVLEGDYDNVEIIVVDDASTDNTPDVIRALELEDSRVCSLRLPNNGGPSVARNAAIAEARLGWIALLDSDDWWAPGRIRYLLGLAATTKADFVSDDIYLVVEGSEIPWTTMYELHNWRQSYEHVLRSDELCERDWIPKPMFRTAWLRSQGLRYDESLRSGEEDFIFFLEALLAGARWVMGDKAFYYYVSRPGALTRSLKLADGLIASAEQMSADSRIRENPLLYQAFAKRLDRIRAARWRNQLAQTVRNGQWFRATTMLGSSPYYIPGLLNALWQRRKLHALRNRSRLPKQSSTI